MNMLKKYLLSSVYRDGNAEGAPEKTPAQIQREQIKVEGTTNDDPPAKEEGDEGKEGEEGEGDGEAEGEGEKEEGEEGEEGEKEEAAADDPEKLKRTIARLQKRIDKKTGGEAELKRQLKEANDALAAAQAGNEGKLSPEEVKREAERIAQETLNKREFEAACNRLADGAEAADKDFSKKIAEVAEEIGELPGRMIGMLDELDNGGAVLAHIANDVELAEKLYAMPQAKLAVQLVRISEKLIAEAKPKPKKVSQVPEPITPLNNSNRGTKVTLHDKMTDAEWIEARQKAVAEKRKSGRVNLY